MTSYYGNSVNRHNQNPAEMMEISTSVRPEDILKAIDAVKGSVADQPAPGFFARLTTPGSSDLAKEIQQVKTLQVRARRLYMERLAAMIDTYVSVHEADLRIRKKAFILATFANLRASVEKATENSLTSFLETFSDNVTRINAIANLTSEQKAQQLEFMYQRILQSQMGAQRAYDDVLEELRREVISVVKEIERK